MSAAASDHLHGEHEQLLIQALRLADPGMIVDFDRASGRLSVSTVLGEARVLTILEGLGIGISPVRGVSRDDGAGSCRGGCG